MFKNVKAKKRLTQVLIGFVVVCMALTGSFLLLENPIKEASAETRDATINATNVTTEWYNKVSTASSGDVVNVTVSGTVSVSSRLIIPTGVTVNLNMGSGSVIKWEEVINGGGKPGFMDTSWSSGSYATGTYWGLIHNSGNLTITGTGSIINKHIAYNTSAGGQTTMQRMATIYNGNGTLTVGSGVTLQAYCSYIDTDDSGYKDIYIYNTGIYNYGGTVNFSGKIYAGSQTTGYQGSTNAYLYSISYGIYSAGGAVNTNGGTVDITAVSAGGEASATCAEKGRRIAMAIGVFSNNAKILGDTDIKTHANSAMSKTKNDNWKEGICVIYSVGVLYTQTNYPVLGAAVDINASIKYNLAAGEFIQIPGMTGSGDGYTFKNDDKPGDWAKRAYSVAGVAQNKNTIGDHRSQKEYTDDGGFFGTNLNFSDLGTAPNTVEAIFGVLNMKYRAEDPAYDNQTATQYVTDAYSTGKTSGQHSAETLTSSITNGAPNSGGTQFNIMYRYYNGSVTPANLTRVSHSYDSSIQSTPAYANVAGSTNYSGVMTDATSTIKLGGGAKSRNEYYYKHESTTFERITPATYAQRSINELSEWSTTGTSLSDSGTSINASNTIVIYINYVLRDPTAIRAVVASKGTQLNQYSTGEDYKSFTAVYTGAPLVPGSDFEIAVIDMGIHASVDTNETSDDTVVTNVYNISGQGSGSGNNATAVTYRYTSDQATWTSGLPKNVGSYYVEISINADTTFAATKTYNRQGAQLTVRCTITKSPLTITGPENPTGIYGGTYAELIPFGEYSVTGKGSDALQGSWSYAGAASTEYPTAGQHTVNLVWTPAPDTATANNYSSTAFTVSLTVEKRAVTVNAGQSFVTYGEAAPVYAISYENLASCDDAKKSAWFSASEFEVYANGTWSPYSAGLAAGDYTIRLKTFGGAADANNTFSVNLADGALTVQKRNIYYNAVAVDREYNGSATVVVNLNYVKGNYKNDLFDAQIATTGEMTQGPDAGEGKAVNVVTDSISLKNSNNYTLVIENRDSLTVNILKATPAGVSVAASPATVVYDSTKTLNTATTLHTVSADVAGSWSWKLPDTIPTCDVASYTAVFTPANTNNYKSIEQAVTLTVEQKQIIVSVKNFDIVYGDAVPALSGNITYTGFTGTDTVDTIGISGTVEPTTTYQRGSGVNTYPINVVSSLVSTNYYFTAQDSAIVVSKRPLTITANSFDVVYGAPTPELNADDITASGFYGSENLATLGGTANVSTIYAPGASTGAVGGNYPVKVTGFTSPNYEITYVDGRVNVAQATLTVTPDSRTVTYGADAPQYVANRYYAITGFVADDTQSTVAISGEPAITTGYSSGQNTGVYPVNVSVSAMSATNYKFVGQEATLSVTKATPVIVVAPNADVINTQKYSTAVFRTGQVVQNPNTSSMEVAGKFTLKDIDTVAAYSGGSPFHVTAVFTPTDSSNYLSVETQVLLLVAPKQITGTPVIQGSAMEGKTLTLNLASMDPTLAQYYSIQWYVAGNPIAGANTTTYRIQATDIGQVIHVKITANKGLGFIGEATSATTSPIIQALLETTAAQLAAVLPEGVVYDAFSHKATVTLAEGYDAQYFGPITVKYNGSTTAPTNAGTYIVTVDVGTPTEPAGGYIANKYYGPATGINVGTFTIERAPLTINVIPNNKVYDGTTDATATMFMAGVKDEMDDVRVAEGSKFAFDTSQVGTDKIVSVSSMELIGSSAPNYRIVVEPATADITPATLTARVSGVTKEYDGSTLVAVEFSNIYGYASVDSRATVQIVDGSAYAVSANAGVQNLTGITCRLEGTSKNNYVVAFDNADTATVTITQATPNVTAPVISGIVYDSAKTLLNIDLAGYTTANGYWQFNDLTVVPTVPQTRYAATYMSTNTNYKNVTADITLNVSPKAVVLTADDKSVVYGSRAPVFTITAQGFTGEDTLADIGGSCISTCTYSPGSRVDTYQINLNNALHDDNYTFTTVPGNLVVTPATLNISAAAENKIYDGSSAVTVNFAIVSGKYGNDDVRLSYSQISGTAATANAGTTTVSYIAPMVVGEKAENYEIYISPASGVLTVVIAKADVEGVVFPNEAEVQFGYNLTHAVFATPGIGNGVFAYENAKETVPGEPNLYNNYKVIFTPADSRNYNTQEQIVPLFVTNCELNYVVGIAGTPQQGEALQVVFTGIPDQALDYVKYQWFRVSANGNDVIADATSDRYIATEQDVGCTLMVLTYFESSDPFEYNEAANVTEVDTGVFGIIGETADAIKEISLSFWQRLINWIRRIIAAITGVTMGMGK